jgi:hypothetical protein
MAGIDAKVVLGLAGKMGQVFVDEGEYQAFPLAPIGLKADSLQALVSDSFGAGANAHAQFSLLVNQIPTGPLWQPQDTTLWDVYGEILTDAELLEKSRTPKQQQAYDKAFGVLYKTKGGTTAPSPKVVAYEQYRDAYLAAAMEYNNRKGAALTSLADAAVKEAWQSDEPTLLNQVQEAAAAWSTKGNRADVEEARRVLSDLSSDSPQVAWAGYRKLFDPTLPEIFFRTSVEGLSYLPTSYVPTDVVDVEWPRITVTAEELGTLAEFAPEELRSRLGSSGDAGITEVSFDYSYITISRPWFTPALFQSKEWRFRDPGRMLSDGANPPTGECTAYVTGLVLARNISVHVAAAADGGGGGEEAPPVDLGFLPNVTLMRDLQLHAVRPVDLTPAVEARMVVLDSPAVWSGARLSPGLAASAIAVAAPAAEAEVFASVRATASEPTLNPADDESRRPSTSTPADEVYVLALQCRRLPRCPASARAGAAVSGTQYTVVGGDTLGKIAGKVYGDPSRWQQIYDANRGVIGPNPNVIRVGQKLTIP